MTGHAHHFSAAGRGHRDARLDVVIAPEPIAVGELPGTVEQVAVAVRRPVAPGPVLAEAEPDAGLDQGLHGQRSHRTGGDGDDGHVGVGQEIDQLALARLAHSGQGEAVADRYVPLHPARLHSLADQVELERSELATVVRSDATRYLTGVSGARGARGAQFDVVFADPPYLFDGWTELLNSVNADVVVCESDRAIAGTNWQTHRVRRYGTPVVTVLLRDSASAGDPGMQGDTA